MGNGGQRPSPTLMYTRASTECACATFLGYRIGRGAKYRQYLDCAIVTMFIINIIL